MDAFLSDTSDDAFRRVVARLLASPCCRSPAGLAALHATLLYLLGLDHQRLTFRHSGRDFRLTDVAGNVVREIIA